MDDLEIWRWLAYVLVGLVDVALLVLSYEIGKQVGFDIHAENADLRTLLEETKVALVEAQSFNTTTAVAAMKKEFPIKDSLKAVTSKRRKKPS